MNFAFVCVLVELWYAFELIMRVMNLQRPKLMYYWYVRDDLVKI
jgi:hypothetical protein